MGLQASDALGCQLIDSKRKRLPIAVYGAFGGFTEERWLRYVKAEAIDCNGLAIAFNGKIIPIDSFL